MNSDTPTKSRSRRKTWIAVLCAIALTVLFVMLARRPREMVTFRIINRSTQTPVTDVHLVIADKWTTLPVDKLGLPFLTGWRTQQMVAATGTIKIPVRRKVDRLLTVTFEAARYHGATFSLGPGQSARSIHYKRGEETYWDPPLGTNKEEVVVELCRKLAGLGE